jgi:hypothetical protein
MISTPSLRKTVSKSWVNLLSRSRMRKRTGDDRPARSTLGAIRRRDRLGGLLHEYYRAAA